MLFRWLLFSQAGLWLDVDFLLGAYQLLAAYFHAFDPHYFVAD